MRSPILVALLHPLNITMAGITFFAGLMSAWWLFPIGVVLWLLMVLNVSRDRALRFNAEMQRREPVAQRFQRGFDKVERAQVTVFNTLSASPPRVRKILEPIQVEVDQLTEQVHALCRRMTSLENYRIVSQSQSQSNLTDELRRLAERIEKTEDPLVREGYAETQRVLVERLERLNEIAAQLDGVDAQVLSAANELDGVITEIVRLQAAEPERAKVNVGEIVVRLRQQMAQLRAFEQAAVQVRGVET